MKFRVFDKRYNTYLSPVKVGNMLWDALNSKDYILELSSELLDGAGREIYDGDILQDEDNYLWTVSYSKEEAMFQLSDGSVAENFGNVSSKWYMIVGNINENKELLE